MDYERILSKVARAVDDYYTPKDDPEDEDEEQDEYPDPDDIRDERLDRDI